MSAGLPDASSDIKVWGLVLNDALRIINNKDEIYLSNGATTPPSILAGTKFWRYNTDTYLTPSSPSTGNTAYPVSTSITYNKPDAIFELASRTFAWGAGGFPSVSNSTLYYMYCSAAEDTSVSSIGRGVYNVTTSAPSYDVSKGGWYDANNYRYIAAFYVNNVGIVTDMFELTSELIGFNYITSAGTSLSVTVPTGIPYHHKYRAIFSTKNNSTTTTSTVNIVINAATTTTNYRSNTLVKNGTTVTLTQQNTALAYDITAVGGAGLGGCGNIVIDIVKNNTTISPMYNINYYEAYSATSTTLRTLNTIGFYTAATTQSLTSLGLTGTQNFAAGGYLLLYKV